MERILVELGAMKQMITESKEKIEQLNTKVGIQNGRVGKLEVRNIVIQTVTAVVGAMTTLVLIPLAFILLQHWLNKA